MSSNKSYPLSPEETRDPKIQILWRTHRIAKPPSLTLSNSDDMWISHSLESIGDHIIENKSKAWENELERFTTNEIINIYYDKPIILGMKVGYAAVFTDITRRGSLPEEASIHIAEMTAMKEI